MRGKRAARLRSEPTRLNGSAWDHRSIIPDLLIQVTNSAHVIWIVRPEIGQRSRYRLDDPRLSLAPYRVGWAAVAAKDEKMAQWLRDAQQGRQIIANTH